MPEDDRINSIKEQIQRGHSAEYGFLHIPKTGGSGLVSYGKSLVERNYRFPCLFPHSWKVQQVLAHFPEIRLCFILRDPLARMISGFNSRMRQGRPTYNNIWTPGEATAFVMFPSIRHLLDGMLSEDEYKISSVRYAMRNIKHLRWNYAFYFQNVEALKSNRSRFRLIGTMESMDKFINEMTELAGAPESLAAELYEKRHASGTTTESVLDQYSDEDLARLRKHLHRDYRIYSKLMSFASQPVREG